MREKYIAGAGLDLRKDMPDLIEWIERRIDKQSKQVIDMAFLPLLVAEVQFLMVEKHWCYDEPYDDASIALRVSVKALAKEVFSNFSKEF